MNEKMGLGGRRESVGRSLAAAVRAVAGGGLTLAARASLTGAVGLTLAVMAGPAGIGWAVAAPVKAPVAEMPVLGTVEIVESVPGATVYDLPQLRNAPDVWLDMVGRARRSLDIETFYFSDDPAGPDPLDDVLAAVEAAARRGVRVRAVADKRMNGTYPETCARMGTWPNAECRLLDARALWGGVQHAKLFVVDCDEFFVGSQNWDWRALVHIRECGVRVRSHIIALALARLFEFDWQLAGGVVEPDPMGGTASCDDRAIPAGPLCDDQLVTAHGDTVLATMAASPVVGLPVYVSWDWPLLAAVIDSARTRVRLQMLSYNPAERGGTYWDDLDAALRRAGARGVQVQVILSNWAKRKSSLPWIRSLAAAPNVEVRFTNVPEAASGFIPYARVEHAKYLVADDDACWVGTSNGSRDYFYESRNVSLFFYGRHGQGVAADLTAFFEAGWNGPYAEPVSPCGEYAPPRIGE